MFSYHACNRNEDLDYAKSVYLNKNYGKLKFVLPSCFQLLLALLYVGHGFKLLSLLISISHVSASPSSSLSLPHVSLFLHSSLFFSFPVPIFLFLYDSLFIISQITKISLYGVCLTVENFIPESNLSWEIIMGILFLGIFEKLCLVNNCQIHGNCL